jgi:hypothetical protein
MGQLYPRGGRLSPQEEKQALPDLRGRYSEGRVGGVEALHFGVANVLQTARLGCVSGCHLAYCLRNVLSEDE